MRAYYSKEGEKMKAIKCEMCGGLDFVKEEGLYVCQHCGAKYTVEEAKKLMVEGTVKIDMSETTQKYLQLARRARETKDDVNAAKYYSLVAEENPDDWESVFYSTYFSCFHITNGEIGSAALLLKNKLETVGKMVFALEGEEKEKAALEVTNSLLTGSVALHAASENYFRSLPTLAKSTKVVQEYTQRTGIIGSIPLVWGNILYDNSESGSAIREKCFAIYKVGITILESSIFYKNTLSVEQLSTPNAAAIYPGVAEGVRLIELAANRIREVEPEYKTEREKAMSGEGKKGCYIATCVYGSYDCPQVWTLRRYRDETLGSTWYGRAFIRVYYAVSPKLVKWLGDTKWFKKMWQGYLDRKVKKLQLEGFEDTPYDDMTWTK